MKILQINKYHFIKGGADSVFFNTMELLKNHGHQVIPFSIKHSKNLPSPYEKYFVDAPEIRELPLTEKLKSIGRFFYDKNAAKKLEMLILQEKPDIAHLHNIFNGISLSILPVLYKYKIPIVITLHDTRLICPSSYFSLRGKKCDSCLRRGGINCGLYKCYQDSLFNSWMCAMEMFFKEKIFHYDQYIGKYIFVSNRYKYTHSLRHEFFEKKGTVLYNFIPNIEGIKTVDKKGKYLFYYGRVTIEKGIKTLVEVMKDLPDYQLKIAGTGNLMEELQAMNLPNVEFLGFRSGNELFDTLKNSAFVIVPSEWEENNPMTVIESYAYGKPVIGSRIGGIPEIIDEGKTGFTFEAFSKDNLKRAITEAMAVSDDQYKVMSEKARLFANNNFNPEIHYNHLIEIYKSLLR